MNMGTAALRAVIFDWAGTTVDFGSLAPTQVFLEIFRRRGVDITTAEAREPMGRAKRDHIAAVCAMPRVAASWQNVHGKLPCDADVQAIYDEFLHLQMEVLARHADVIPGVPAVVAELRRRGVKIGSTTGYTQALMNVLYPAAAANGFAPDNVVCSDDVANGRPTPWMLYRSMERLGVYPAAVIAAVDDTPVGVQASRNLGSWTIAVTRSGNAMGLSEAEITKLPSGVIEKRLEQARQMFTEAGAHYVIESVADLLPIVDDINRRLSAGERP